VDTSAIHVDFKLENKTVSKLVAMMASQINKEPVKTEGSTFYAYGSPKIEIQLMGMSVQALLDTGSEVSGISLPFAKILQSEGLITLDESVVWNMNMANNTTDRTGGCVHELPFRVGGIEYRLPFFVINGASNEILLGQNFRRLARMNQCFDNEGNEWGYFRDPESDEFTWTKITSGDHPRHKKSAFVRAPPGQDVINAIHRVLREHGIDGEVSTSQVKAGKEEARSMRVASLSFSQPIDEEGNGDFQARVFEAVSWEEHSLGIEPGDILLGTCSIPQRNWRNDEEHYDLVVKEHVIAGISPPNSKGYVPITGQTMSITMGGHRASMKTMYKSVAKKKSLLRQRCQWSLRFARRRKQPRSTLGTS
jgi:hypothetical protein